ncbi:hypothetical protein KCU78_g2781, partial [Aureobasidium melanogenum]
MALQNSLYVDAPLRQMHAAYDATGLHGLAKCILELESKHAISPHTSRILDSDDYNGNAEFLLAQIPDQMLRSILSNTLPADVASGRLVLERWAEISFQPQHKDTLEPGIYANYLAPRDGSPLSLLEFQHFLDGLKSAVLDTRMNDQAQTDVSGLVDAYYRLNYGNGRTLLDTIRGPNLTSALETYLRVNDARLQDAQLQNSTHISIHGDCGWAINVHDRCKQHRTLVSSPALFRLANCVLSVLFPHKDFKMHHFCLFRAFQSVHAGIGESMGSHLITSYSTYGGFNFAQAGISVTKAKELTGNGWMTVSDRHVKLLEKATTTVNDGCDSLDVLADSEENEVQRRHEYHALGRERAAVQDLEKQLTEGDKKLGDDIQAMSDLIKSAEMKVAKNKKRVEKRDEEKKRLADAFGADNTFSEEPASSKLPSAIIRCWRVEQVRQIERDFPETIHVPMPNDPSQWLLGLNKNVLMHFSSYFRTMLDGSSGKSVDIIELDLELDLVLIFAAWLSHSLLEHDILSSSSLIQLYIFADSYDFPALRRDIMLILAGKCGHTPGAESFKSLAQMHVFSKLSSSSPLYQWLVETHIHHSTSLSDDQGYEEVPREFLFLICRGFAQNVDDRLCKCCHNPCDYHEHESEEEWRATCYAARPRIAKPDRWTYLKYRYGFAQVVSVDIEPMSEE